MEEVWFRLWSSLCHQGDVFTASIAAVPHLVKVALSVTNGLLASDLISLPVSIEESRMERPHQIHQADIDDDYWDAILDLQKVCGIAALHPGGNNLAEACRSAAKLLSGRPGRRLAEQKVGSDLGELFR